MYQRITDAERGVVNNGNRTKQIRNIKIIMYIHKKYDMGVKLPKPPINKRAEKTKHLPSQNKNSEVLKMRNYYRTISLNKASKVTGVNVVTMRKDIEKGRIDAFYYRGRYHIEVGELIRYADYIHHSNRAVLICPMPVILHRIDYMIFKIFE